MLLALAFSLALQTGGASIRTVDKGTQSGVGDGKERNVVVRTPDEWQKLWREHADGKPLPPVDFSREMVVGVFLGTRPTAGYGVEIVGTREEDGALVVEYRAASPGRDAITAQVITSPYHLVAVPKRAGDVRFAEQ